MDDRWASVDTYVTQLLVGEDAALARALSASEAARLPSINVTAPHGKFLHLLSMAIGASRVLEIGTLGAYSTIWIARALPPGGKIVTIEADRRHADVARANIEAAGVSERVELRVGKALDVLPEIERENAGPFDLTFIDADKPNTPEYFDWAIRLSRPGSVILVDNVVRNGAIADAPSSDASVQAMQRLLTQIGSEPRVSATVMQTVGAKGYDGFALALVRAATAQH